MTRFTLRALPDGTQTKQRSLKRTLAALRRRVSDRGPHTLEYNNVYYSRREHSTREMLLRVSELMRKAAGPERIKVYPSRGPVQAIRKEITSTVPHINTPGTDGIDEIYSALHAKFDSQWPVRDMGICVDKDGEHGECNAYDAGTEMNIPAEETWRRITVMAKWLVREGQRYVASGGKYGLPVYGVIWMDRIWYRGLLTSKHYDGVRHVSHLHVSAYPSHTGWV